MRYHKAMPVIFLNFLYCFPDNYTITLHAASLSTSNCKRPTCFLLCKWWISHVPWCVFSSYLLLPSRNLASGSTMLLLEREESHSCCSCTASRSSGRSKKCPLWLFGNSLHFCSLCTPAEKKKGDPKRSRSLPPDMKWKRGRGRE